MCIKILSSGVRKVWDRVGNPHSHFLILNEGGWRHARKEIFKELSIIPFLATQTRGRRRTTSMGNEDRINSAGARENTQRLRPFTHLSVAYHSVKRSRRRFVCRGVVLARRQTVGVVCNSCCVDMLCGHITSNHISLSIRRWKNSVPFRYDTLVGL